MNDSITTASFRVYRHIDYRRFVLWIWHRQRKEETAKLSQPVLLPKSAVSFPLSSTLAFGIPDQLDHCRENLLRRVATSWSLLYRSHFEVNDGGWYPRSLSASWPAVWYERNCPSVQQD